MLVLVIIMSVLSFLLLTGFVVLLVYHLNYRSTKKCADPITCPEPLACPPTPKCPETITCPETLCPPVISNSKGLIMPWNPSDPVAIQVKNKIQELLNETKSFACSPESEAQVKGMLDMMLRDAAQFSNVSCEELMDQFREAPPDQDVPISLHEKMLDIVDIVVKGSCVNGVLSPSKFRTLVENMYNSFC